jgi:hypothetical protein
MKTHMLKMHGIHLEASGGGSQIGGVQCDICHKELCSKYFLKVHKQNTHGIVFPDHEMLLPNGVGGPAGNMLKEQQHQGVMDLSFHQHHHHQQQQQQQQQQQMQQQMMEGSNSPVKSNSVTESCPLCPKRFKSSKALKAHLSHEHSGSSGSSTAACCYICSQQFGDVVALQVHLIKSHASHLMDHHQTPPPPVSVSTSVAAATPTAGGSEQQQANQGCPMSSPSPKTSPSSFQRSSYCDYSAGYLFANERGGQMGESCPPPPPMPGLVPASANASPRPSSAVGTRSPPAAVNQQKIQCPLCGHQLPLEQFQTHLMAHQFPINFLHTLMPPSSSAGTATAPESHAHEEQEHDELGAINQQQQQQQQQRNTTTTTPTTGRRKRRYRCSVCSRKFATRQLCLTHILQRHPPSMRSSHNSGGSMTNAKSGIGFGLSSPTSPVSTCHMIQSQQRPLTCPRCGYATRQPQLLRLHLRTQQCIPVVARNPDLQQLPPYLAVPTSTASMGGPHAGSPSRLSAIINNKQGLGLQSVQGQHAHRQDFVLQAFLLTQPDAETNKSSSSSNANAKNRRGGDPGANQENGHHNNHDDQVMDPSTVAIKRESQQNGNRLSGQDSEERKRTTTDQQKDRPADAATKEPRDGNGDDEDEEEEGQNQSCNFIPSLILLPVNRRIANPLSLTFSLTPA